MEEEKETAEEKEEEEEENHHLTAAASSDYQELPIMHWEDLSQRIAELEKQEQERVKRGAGLRMEEAEEEDARRRRVAVVTSRFHNHRNLQLCFINSSDSEEEEQGTNEKLPMGTRPNGCHAAGLKQEVATALRTLRDELLAEQRENELLASSSCVAKRKHLEHRELQERSEQQLISLRMSLQQEVHALSSELVAHLLVRDQLRTKQDAMLLDVQDLT
ncbi:schwannomin-interacting protein 1 [Leuresthes tenuis]|uniref:schwannomin-interacting protein 1 n=1 Tax=Leuresthes tenuis TaxID=355514 RepID=UPI003B50AA58